MILIGEITSAYHDPTLQIGQLWGLLKLEHMRNLPAFCAVALIQYGGLKISVFVLRRRKNVPSTDSRPKKCKGMSK